jgi:hypothetical protein
MPRNQLWGLGVLLSNLTSLDPSELTTVGPCVWGLCLGKTPFWNWLGRSRRLVSVCVGWGAHLTRRRAVKGHMVWWSMIWGPNSSTYHSPISLLQWAENKSLSLIDFWWKSLSLLWLAHSKCSINGRSLLVSLLTK